jgi:imidazolonepropionase-like amidohydrolase
MTIVFECCSVFDGVNEELLENVCVTVDASKIVEVGVRSSSNAAYQRVNCQGRVLMPGLIDAHVHAYAPSFSFFSNDRLPPALLAIHASTALQGMLLRGFTTVRDAGGGDVGLWLAIERGVISGPRFFYSGKAISQTGGHGDMRAGHQAEPCGCGGYSGSISKIADGADAVRAAAREELRKGAHQIKLFVSGGVTSPSDPIWMNQFTDDEIRAAVDEAMTRRTYVMAHCHTDEAVRRCISLGVRSIEHGTNINDATAVSLAASGMYVVPTLSVADITRRRGHELGMPPASLEKVSGVYDQMAASIEACAKAGVSIGLGSDILGREFQELQGGELALRGEIQRSIDVLRSATSVNAALLQQQGQIGCIAPGAWADILVLDGNPLQNLSLFRDPLKNIPVVMKNGEFIRNALR